MSVTHFTPGPHEAEPSDHLGDPAYAIKASDGDYLAVGCTLWDGYLFAAAPDLYRALADLLCIAQDEGIVGDNTTIPAAAAALAKARGEA